MTKEAATLPRRLYRLKGEEETMVAHKVTSRVVASDCMPTTAGTLCVSAVVLFRRGK